MHVTIHDVAARAGVSLSLIHLFRFLDASPCTSRGTLGQLPDGQGSPPAQIGLELIPDGIRPPGIQILHSLHDSDSSENLSRIAVYILSLIHISANLWSKYKDPRHGILTVPDSAANRTVEFDSVLHIAEMLVHRRRSFFLIISCNGIHNLPVRWVYNIHQIGKPFPHFCQR